MMLSDKEKDELYGEFKQRFLEEIEDSQFSEDLFIGNRRYIEKRNTFLSRIRINHGERYMKERFGNDGKKHRITPYFNGWSQISQLVAKAYNVPSVSSIRGTSYESKALEFAQKLSDLYFEYAWFNNKEGENHESN